MGRGIYRRRFQNNSGTMAPVRIRIRPNIALYIRSRGRNRRCERGLQRAQAFDDVGKGHIRVTDSISAAGSKPLQRDKVRVATQRSRRRCPASCEGNGGALPNGPSGGREISELERLVLLSRGQSAILRMADDSGKQENKHGGVEEWPFTCPPISKTACA